MMQAATYVTAAGVFAVGLWGMMTQRDMIKICVSISVMESAAVMALVATAYVPGGTAPIRDPLYDLYVDPLPHALALTAIVIGAGILAIALALSVAMYRHYGTTDLTRIFRRIRGSE
ncbi:MAG: sodium:proton antiporter [Alkalispirochaeta sp.]